MTNKLVLLFFLLTVFCKSGLCQAKGTQCKTIQNGEFYFYPKDSKISYKIIRNGSIQKEVNLDSGDTSFWKVKWVNDCSFIANYIGGLKSESAESISFLKAHKTCIRIQPILPFYLIVSGFLDSFDSKNYVTDTLWLKPR